VIDPLQATKSNKDQVAIIHTINVCTQELLKIYPVLLKWRKRLEQFQEYHRQQEQHRQQQSSNPLIQSLNRATSVTDDSSNNDDLLLPSPIEPLYEEAISKTPLLRCYCQQIRTIIQEKCKVFLMQR
jgi:hypothetical protein